MDRAFRAAALDLGYGWADDHNAPGSIGVSPWAMNRSNGARVSTNDAYLEPARSRPNLTIRGQTLVDQVEFAGKRVVGVLVHSEAGWEHLRAREVIICAGAIHSPAILLRSGIGPAEELRALGRNVVAHVPGVGQNLCDHPTISLPLILRPTAQAQSADERIINVCLRYTSDLIDGEANDMIAFPLNLLSGLMEPGLAFGALHASVYRSFSTGNIRLVTLDPEAEPEVNFRLLSDERDLVRLRDGVRRLFVLSRHPAFTGITEMVTVGASGLGPAELTEDSRLDQCLLAECFPLWHACGACRMGAAQNPMSVVDSECRVIGVERLRVVDASIMPEVPRANTNLTTIMIAEHIAARMKRR